MFRQISILLFTILFGALPVFCQFDLIKVPPTPQPTVNPSPKPIIQHSNSTDNDESNKPPEKTEKMPYELGDEIITYTGEAFGICSIAYSYGISCEKLADYNGLDSKAKLPPNAKIKVLVTAEIQKKLKNLAESKFKSGVLFKQALLNLQDARRPQAGEDFNHSMEIFLMSGINVNQNLETLNCYNTMVETIYRIEFPSPKQLPQIRSLASICGWDWNSNDYKLADVVTKIVESNVNVGVEVKDAKPNNANNRQAAGFNEQKFEASPLDELGRLELTPEELEKIPQKRPLIQPMIVKVVTAKSGDTVTKLAEREGISAVELARYNHY